MPPMFIDGHVPVLGLTSVEASVNVTTPYINQTAGAELLGVPAPLNPDTLAILTQTQTLSSKTFLAPIIMGGSIASANMTQPVITSGVFTSPMLDSPLLTGAMSGGILNNVILGARTVVSVATGTPKTLDLSTGDVFIVQLTAACTLTISNGGAGKTYQVVLAQGIADSYTGMSWMTGFINEKIASGPTQRTGAMDFWTITYDGSKNYGLGAKDVQG